MKKFRAISVLLLVSVVDSTTHVMLPQYGVDKQEHHVYPLWVLSDMSNHLSKGHKSWQSDDLNYRARVETDKLLIGIIESEIDEMWSFLGNKKNKQWIWIAMDARSRQIIAFHVGDRSGESARKLWESIPKSYRDKATFYTDDWQAYKGVIPKERHRVVKGKANHIERFNCTVRQRISRLVRKSLSFSKKLENHIGAIKYFICHYNLQRALHV